MAKSLSMNVPKNDEENSYVITSFWENDLRVHRLFFDREDDAKNYFNSTSLDRVLAIEDEHLIPTDRSMCVRTREHLFYVELKGIEFVIVK